MDRKNTGQRFIDGIVADADLQNQVDANTANIAINTADIATNTADIATNVIDISGKQDTLSNASNITLRTLNFPDAISANTGNLTLPGNTQLFSGNAPAGVQAKIQNGNLLNFVSLQNTLLTNITLGANWKYQNAASYAVNNANGGILERIDPTSGQHNWYKLNNIGIVMAWQPQNDRLFLSGEVLANKYLHRISGTVVRGYGFFRFQGTSGTINMNTTGGVDIPWSNIHVDGTTFLPVGTGTQVKIVETGYYEVNFNVYCTSTAERANPTIRIRINGLDTAYLAWSYIRASTNHNENSWTLSPVLMSLAANDVISVQGRFTSNGNSGGCYLYSNSASINKAFSSLMLKRVA